MVLGYPPGNRVPSYSNTEVWTTVHAGMAIVCASLPTFKPLVNRISRTAFITRISSLLSLQRSGESLRSSTDGVVVGSKEKGRRSRGSTGKGSNEQTKRSPLVTIGRAEMDLGFSNHPGLAYPERVATNYTGQRDSSLERNRSEEDLERGLLPQLPHIEASESLRLSFLHS